MYDYKNFCKIIGRNITFLREQRDISKADLAKELKLSPTSICNFENGNAMSMKNFIKICSHFNIEPSAMMYDMSRHFYNGDLYLYAGKYYLYYLNNSFGDDSDKIEQATLDLTPSNKYNFLSAKIETKSSKYKGKFKLSEDQFTISLTDDYKTLTICGLPVKPINMRNHNYLGGVTLTLSVCHGREHRPIFYKQLMSRYPLNDEDKIRDFLLLNDTNKSVRLKRSCDSDVYHFIKEQNQANDPKQGGVKN